MSVDRVAASESSVGSDAVREGDLVPREERERIRILVIDDDASTLESCKSILANAGYRVEVQRKSDEAIRRLKSKNYQIVLLDQRMPEMDGFEVLGHIRMHSPDTLAVMMTGYATAEASAQALQAGAWDYLPKPFTATQLLVLVGRAAHRVQRMRSVGDVEDDAGVLVEGSVPILGVSRAMKELVKRATKVAGTDASVFITGESGTGKELIARFIHEESRRSQESFVPINCAALPGELLESEMFGHRKGAFTGAVREKPGLLEVAHRGTVFLDELCEMPVELQPKLLRVLQDGVIRRVGSEKNDAVVDIRFVSATNRNLEKALENGELRHDLYYRLRVVPIHMPPLRERREDIPVLVRHFVEHFWKHHQLSGDGPPEVSPEAMERFKAYQWPGNVRELQNVIEQIVVLSESGEIEPDDVSIVGNGVVPSRRSAGEGDDVLTSLDFDRPYHALKDELIGRFERNYLLRVVRRANGNMSEAARRAGIDRTTLYRLMDKHEISKDEINA